LEASSAPANIFNNLPALQTPDIRELIDELARYLSTGWELHVKDGLLWWFKHKHIYSTLYQMAIDYLSIPGKLFVLTSMSLPLIPILLATSVEVEWTFSQGRLLLSHVHSQLSVQSMCALLCLGVWSSMGYVKDDDIKAAAVLPEVDGEEEDLADDWESIDCY